MLRTHPNALQINAGDMLGWSWRRRRQEEKAAIHFLDTMNVPKANLLEHPHGIEVKPEGGQQ